MLSFKFFGFPTKVHWLFWVIIALLSGALSTKTPDDWLNVIVSMVVIFISILVHELGHALAAKRYGGVPRIELHGLGGLTYLGKYGFTRQQSIFISAAGPLCGFILAGLFFVTALLIQMSMVHDLVATAIGTGLWVNVFWTAFNLLPVLPMDGGQILYHILGPKRVRLSCTIGAVTAVLVAIVAVQYGLFIAAIFLGFMAFNNFRGVAMQGGVR
ncbi:MAG: site-2 protease family protein [Verrucomicrobiota bacterium]